MADSLLPRLLLDQGLERHDDQGQFHPAVIHGRMDDRFLEQGKVLFHHLGDLSQDQAARKSAAQAGREHHVADLDGVLLGLSLIHI